jgi:hypothetical protein
MTMPALEKSYEFDVNRWWPISNSSLEEAARELSILIKDQWLDQSHHGIGGTIAAVTPGVTYSLQISLGNVAGNILEPGSEDFTTALIGKYVEFSGASNGGNNGVFLITGVPAANTIEFANTGGVPEAFTGNFRISRGNITSGAGGQMSPWRCQGSGAGTTGRGSGHDGHDRWLAISDLQSSTVSGGNKSWFVFENTITGVQWCLVHWTNSTAYDWMYSAIYTSPELGFSTGSATQIPTAPDRQTCLQQSDWLGTQVNAASRNWFGNLIVSTDGVQTFYFNAVNGNISNGAHSTIPVVHSDFASAPRPWSGNQGIFMWDSFLDTVFWTISSLTDTARYNATIDHLGVDGGPYNANLVMTGEFIGASQVPEVFDWNWDLLAPLQWPFFNIGLYCVTTGVRGRLGRLQDIWMINTRTGREAPQGSYFPGTTARTRLKLGEFAIPWNGSVLKVG